MHSLGPFPGYDLSSNDQWNACEKRHDVEGHHAFIGCDGGALDAFQEFQGVGEAVFRVSNERS